MIHARTVEATVTAAFSDASGCAQLIRKLRWIGLHDEACRLEQELRIVDSDQRVAVVAEPRITD